MTSLERAIQESKEREERARSCGCLPSDNCTFDRSTGKCVFCTRAAGTQLNTYDEQWSEVEKQRIWEPKWRELFLSALKCIELMQAMAGHPDPSEACRNIIKQGRYGKEVFNDLAKKGLGE